MLEALVQPPKDVEDEDPVINGCAEVSQIVGHGLELAAVLINREVTLNKSMKSSIKVKSTVLTVTEKLVLDGTSCNHIPGPPGEDPPRWSC
jgi:hypothetical protein